MSRKLIVKLVALAAILTLVAGACSSSSGGGGGGAKKGGNIIIAAEQFPDCLNVIDTCGNASWLHWGAAQFVIPKAMTLDKDNNFVPSPLITEAPTLDNGGLKTNPFTVTFHINPSAVWEDGTPITWQDFEFTRLAVLKTTGTLGTLGYDKITSIKAGKDDKEVVITFKEIFADWPDLFGGVSTNGYVLKKAAFPKGPNTAGTMQDSIPFSGGPWLLQKFTKDQQITLVPNPKWWGHKPNADQVTVVAREEQTTEINSLLSGEVFAAYPQPSGGSLTDQIGGKPGMKFFAGGGSTYEQLWLNMDPTSPGGKNNPLVDKAVRQAFAYAVDRQAVLDKIIKPNNPNATILNCSGWVPTVSDWCNNNDYAKYTYDPAKAKDLLKGAGWNCPATGTCTKGGKKLTVIIHTTAGNVGRKDALEIVQDKAKAAGFDIQLKFLASPSPIFTDFLPKRQHMVALFANSASPDPSVTTLFASDQIPDASGSGGQNWSGWKNAEATKACHDSDLELDHAKRRDLIHKIGALEAEDIPALPLYQKPLITVWREDKIGGPIQDFTLTSLGPFYNIDQWYVK